MPVNEQNNCCLFRLPAELRNQIYDLALIGNDANANAVDLSRAKPPTVDVLLACRAIYHECGQLYTVACTRYWATTSFKIYDTHYTNSCSTAANSDKAALAQINDKVFACIKDLEIHTDFSWLCSTVKMSHRFANYLSRILDFDNRVAGPDVWSGVLRRTSENWELVGGKAKRMFPSVWRPCSVDFHPDDGQGIERAWICVLDSEIQASAAAMGLGRADCFVPLTREELRGLNFL
ncbi:hypothetical protein LTR86_007108 [Recurvomyces mirabilis]|nr:hypothetical protein LTR86_007108 [Recurvomyces mirabilis]